jgi:hypothetical protein
VIVYGALFVLAMITPIYSFSTWTLTGIHRVWPLVFAVAAMIAFIALRQSRGALLGQVFGAWIILAGVSALTFDLTWGGQALLTAIISLVVSLPWIKWRWQQG